MDIYTAIEYICSIDEELKAISVLLNSHRKKHEQNFKDLCDREKPLEAICKLNNAKYKDEAIDALSDVDKIITRQTNADRIRAMSDEKLGVFLAEWAEKPWAWKRDGEGECLAWLREPVKNDDDND